MGAGTLLKQTQFVGSVVPRCRQWLPCIVMVPTRERLHLCSLCGMGHANCSMEWVLERGGTYFTVCFGRRWSSVLLIGSTLGCWLTSIL